MRLSELEEDADIEILDLHFTCVQGTAKQKKCFWFRLQA